MEVPISNLVQNNYYRDVHRRVPSALPRKCRYSTSNYAVAASFNMFHCRLTAVCFIVWCTEGNVKRIIHKLKFMDDSTIRSSDVEKTYAHVWIRVYIHTHTHVHNYILITNFMHWLLFIYKLLFLCMFRAINSHLQEDTLYTCRICYCHSLRELIHELS